ncbi:putative GNAT family N-acyltransferase [Catalinimonas alkaloidigena]|uniref:hypothetical protein n=1 Tax=Catalinimonas alkaloidigena TaxID=1075417 RepID=UPI0024070EE2|nr:hypothetical protein [Catalinimonas alkaloidigena]MDF9799234.1 putative GNAT family N-acyltransferase [Catalinimonas alkaloidigena]
MDFEPIITNDINQLQEIFDLRVEVWEKSPFHEIVNKNLFPNGWSDNLDSSGHHIIVHDGKKKIIASARLNFYEKTKSLPFFSLINHVQLPREGPLGYYSRLVVNEKGYGISKKIDEFVINYCKIKSINWIIGLSNTRTELMTNKLGFRVYGKTEIKYHELSKKHPVDIIIKTLKNEF